MYQVVPRTWSGKAEIPSSSLTKPWHTTQNFSMSLCTLCSWGEADDQ